MYFCAALQNIYQHWPFIFMPRPCWVWIKAFNHHLHSFISTVSQQHSWQQHTIKHWGNAVHLLFLPKPINMLSNPQYISWNWITALYSKIYSIIVINSNMFNKLLAVGFLARRVPQRLINITSSKKWKLSEGLLFCARKFNSIYKKAIGR